MIAKISGKLIELKESSILLEAGHLTYEVLIPVISMKKIIAHKGQQISLFTYHYYAMEKGGNNLVPCLIGFVEKIEEEFFEKFVTVKSVGKKTALQALAIPISSIADAIERRDVKTLSALPKIGKRTAEQIIAELKGKVAKFALMKDEKLQESESVSLESDDFREEALMILQQLEYKRTEATQMVDKALRSNKTFKSVEELIQQIYMNN